MVAMNLSSKRKGRWRYRCWQKMFLTLIGLPLSVVSLLVFIAILRATFIQLPANAIIDVLSDQRIDLIDPNENADAVERFAGALRIPTVSYGTDNQEKGALLQMHTYLEKNFPLIHSSSFIKREIINQYSLLYTIQGTTKGKLPYLLASHLDVVPVDSKAWEVPPFSGQIVNNTYIYGRGAMDDKAGVMGILEAVEYMLRARERPQRTFYMAFGHDEEISGKRGAQELAKILKARGVDRLDFVLDEGFPISHQLIPGTDRLIAMVGVSEKGTVTVELSVPGTPGHSSFPPHETSIGILAAAVARLEETPQPSQFGTGPEKDTFFYLAPHVSFGYRILYHNLWLFAGLMARQMEQKPITNAIVRTTTATTMFHGGIKENVIPPSAKAVINHRVHPSQTVAEVIAHDRLVIADPRVLVKVKSHREAHPVSSCTSRQFQLVAASIRQVFHNAIVVPGVFIANTDTRWYLSFTSNLYRFLPTVVTSADVSRYHGNNERISIKHYQQTVNFFYRIIKNADLLIDSVPLTTNHNGAQEL